MARTALRQCILCLALAVSLNNAFDVESYCKQACLWGRGGNLCHCSSVHFAGKRVANAVDLGGGGGGGGGDGDGHRSRLKSLMREHIRSRESGRFSEQTLLPITRYLNGQDDNEADFGDQFPGDVPDGAVSERNSADLIAQTYKDLSNKLARDTRIHELKDKIDQLADRLRNIDFDDSRLEAARRRFVNAWRKYWQRNGANPTSLSLTRNSDWTTSTVNGDDS